MLAVLRSAYKYKYSAPGPYRQLRRSAVTVALRLSTVGREVFDGSGLGVCDASGVSVALSVWVAGITAVGARDVIVSAMGVVTGPEGIDVPLQAMEVMISTTGKISLRLMNEYVLLFNNNIFDLGEV
jgi:hypothetical protein